MKKIAILGALVLIGAGCVTQTPAELVSEENPNIIVSSPVSGEMVSNPIRVTGEVNAFENTVDWRLLDAKGVVLKDGFASADASDVGRFGNYEFWIVVPEVSNPNLTIEVFSFSAKDGSQLFLQSIPVVLEKTQSIEVELYFKNNLLDPDISCEKVFPVTRKMTITSYIERATMLLLLEGPTAEEKSAGYESVIPPFTDLETIEIEGHTVSVDLDGAAIRDELQTCFTRALRAQVEHTLTRFAQVKAVDITIDEDWEIK